MPNTIQHKRSTTASAVPSGASLSAGEIAINTADGRLFIKKSDGTVVAIGRDASELNTGTVAAARLPAATGATLGAIIVGTGLGVSSGTVSVSYGSSGSVACVGNDARLSDARTPTDGSVTTAKIADGAVTAAKIAASQALSVASVSATGNISSNATVSGASLSASTGGVTVSAGAIVIETLGAVTTFRVSSGGIVTSGTWQGATIAVANGGTGATTAADARTNLGAAASSHTHGNITNAGAIGTTSGQIVVTTTSGVLTTAATIAAGSVSGLATSATTDTTNATNISSGTLNSARLPSIGNITNAGAIGSTANLPVITTTSGVLTTGTFGTAANSFCQGNDSRLSCQAWVNFNGTSNTANLSGTYSRSGTTVTVTATAHGLLAGGAVYLDFTSGLATDGLFTVATVADANTFTVTHGTSGTTSGNVTLTRQTIRGSYNVSSVSDNGTGDYTVNFSTAMTDANFAATASCGDVSWGSKIILSTLTANSARIQVVSGSANALADTNQVCMAFFR